MKILLISSYIFGYMDLAVEEMKRQGHEVEVLYYESDPLQFQYQNLWHKTTSGISKLVGLNAKKKAREKALRQYLKEQKFDYTLVIHGQYLNTATHIFLKSISQKYVAYFFDSLAKMPDQKKIAHYFDTVFSYEPEDCENENYTFITNFIPTEKLRSTTYKHTVFNISAYDHRWSKLNRLAQYLAQNNIDFKFKLYSTKHNSLPHFEITPRKMALPEIEDQIKTTKIMVDIQRKDQKGLSFRPFEALGNHKKLITDNPEIKKYDFYKPENILIIDIQNIQIPENFLSFPYQAISPDIYQQYTLTTWVQKILA